MSKTTKKTSKPGKKRVANPLRVQHQEPPIQHQEPPITERNGDRPSVFWPAGESLPEVVVKIGSRAMPCPNCLRVRMDTGSQSVVVTSSRRDVMWFRCRSCGYRWSLPVKIHRETGG